ncbi:hypothetical protein F0562_025071 [Nyssa sinensis]|uniref:F-box domain-containing protein n=1 Tax=Nyssa sinensis TaxID=561372 RepID=A0A5J5BER4_9ASTE|nr:hypothetical protein F0562_025071 [Nyssa sinensis]
MDAFQIVDVNESRWKHATERTMHLPPEIISNILSKLPIDSILRCKCVCKTWHSITQESSFVSMHLSISNKGNPLVILQAREREDGFARRLCLLDMESRKVRYIPQIPFEDAELRDLRIMCSLNGMLCMAPKRAIHPVVIYNPITRKYIVLPESEINRRVISHQAGFGFDPLSKSYKVVRIYDYNNGGLHEVTKSEIITVGDNSWREIRSPYKVLGMGSKGPVFCNGTIYWIINKGHYPYGRAYILTFDMSKEVFGFICFHPSIRAPNYKPYFASCNLQLHIFAGSLFLVEYDGNSLHLWKMTEREAGGFSAEFASIRMDLPLGARCVRSLVYPLTPELFFLEMDGFVSGAWDKNNLVCFLRRYNAYAKFLIPGFPKSFRARPFHPSFLFLE